MSARIAPFLRRLICSVQIRPPDHAPATLSAAETAETLRQHALWLKTEGATGRRCDFSVRDLRGVNFSNCDLRSAVFRGATLVGCNFQNSDLDSADFREANLRDADLSTAKGILSEQFGASNLSGSRFPDSAKGIFPLENISEASKNAALVFFTMLAACVYCLLAIGTTTDSGLITNATTSTLPVIGATIPIVGFYLIAPVVLLCIHSYFLLNLQRLFDQLVKCPAVWPDGIPLDRKVYPWLFNGLACVHVTRLRDTRPPLARVQAVLVRLLGWWIVPATVVLFWLRFFPRHDPVGTLIQCALVSASITLAGGFQNLSTKTLRLRNWRMWPSIIVFVAFFGCTVAFSVGAISHRPTENVRIRQVRALYRQYYGLYRGHPERATYFFNAFLERATDRIAEAVGSRSWAYDLLQRLGYPPRLDLSAADVSIPPERTSDAAGKSSVPARIGEALSGAKGAQLRHARLDDCACSYAFMANADLGCADLRGANFSHADLEGADLSGAWLNEADLDGADLRGIKFLGNCTRLRKDAKDNIGEDETLGARIGTLKLARNWLLAEYSPNMLKALGLSEHHNDKVEQHDFSSYNLAGMNLHGLYLLSWNLAGANLSEANLQSASLIDVSLRQAKLRKADLRSTDLSAADLLGADLSEADLREADLADAQNITSEQIRQAKNWVLAYLPMALLKKLMLPPNHNERLRSRDLQSYDFRALDLSGSEFSDYKLDAADFSNADLSNATFTGASLSQAKLDCSDLRGADLEHAKGVLPDQVRTAITDEMTKLPFQRIAAASPYSCGQAPPKN